MLGKEQCETKLNEMIKGEVLDKKAEIIEYDNYYNVIVKYDVLEDIGTKEKIEFWKDGIVIWEHKKKV